MFNKIDNVTLKRVRITIVSVEKQYYIFFVYVCGFSAKRMHNIIT